MASNGPVPGDERHGAGGGRAGSLVDPGRRDPKPVHHPRPDTHPRPVGRAAAGAHDGPLLVVEQPGQQRAVILDRVSELGHMLRQPRVDALGDGRHIGPEGGHNLGIALVTDIGWMTHT